MEFISLSDLLHRPTSILLPLVYPFAISAEYSRPKRALPSISLHLVLSLSRTSKYNCSLSKSPKLAPWSLSKVCIESIWKGEKRVEDRFSSLSDRFSCRIAISVGLERSSTCWTLTRIITIDRQTHGTDITRIDQSMMTKTRWTIIHRGFARHNQHFSNIFIR